MSTAVVHGLADPKARGKPVSHANEGRRPSRLGGSPLSLYWSVPPGPGLEGEGGVPLPRGLRHTPFPCQKGFRLIFRSRKGGPNVTPSPSLRSGPVGAWAWGGNSLGPGPGGAGPWGRRGFKGHSIGGNTKATFGTLSVNPGRDLFSS
jgi:hypothetical protein